MMCFSAEVSFSTAALLVLTSIACFFLKIPKRYYLIALVPLLFAIQQFSEGLVWLSEKYDNPYLLYGIPGFLFFAFMAWPIWIPLATLKAETVPWKRGALLCLLVLGIVLSAYYFIFGRETVEKTVDRHIIYTAPIEGHPLFYLLATVLPIFISSIPYIWIVGIALLIGYIFSYVFYLAAFISVWCFFASLASILLYFVLRKNQVY
jgi:hypothetical protein